MSADDLEGPPDPITFHGRVLSLAINGKIEAARDLASDLHEHYVSCLSIGDQAHGLIADSFYFQGVKHALNMIIEGRKQRAARRAFTALNPRASRAATTSTRSNS